MPIPYNMFDVSLEAKKAATLEGVYHKGQSRVWNGKEVLAECVAKHGGIELSEEKKAALQRVFSLILWGELAAWKISAQLAAEIEPMEAKMAATSQAHDEARHFYVMHDYLQLLGHEPPPLSGPAHKLLSTVTETSSLVKKLLGMQLMIEPVAITLFRQVRESQVEPVLCDLLLFYERDEARHIALGVNYLPDLMSQMSYAELATLWYWQLRLLFLQVDELRQMEKDLGVLGLDPGKMFLAAEKRQVDVLEETLSGLGKSVPYLIDPFRWAVRQYRNAVR